ncbi:MAG: CHAD domain-containing protein [Blastocatellia bacterium]
MAKPLKIRKISPDDRPENAAKRILRTRIKEFYSHWNDPDQTPTLEQVHNLRISGKRLRYSAESLRELYPDRLTLLIDLLKHSQDLLGAIQDCVTQRGVIEEQLTRMRRRKPQGDQIAVLEKIVSEYERRQSMLLAQFHETWRGMAMDEFRESLKAMASRAKKAKRAQSTQNGKNGKEPETREPLLRVIAAAESFPVDQTGDEPRAEAVVNIDDGNVRGAGVEHP